MKRIVLSTLIALSAWAATTAQALAYSNHCREHTQNIKIDGRTERAYGVACLQPDGT